MIAEGQIQPAVKNLIAVCFGLLIAALPWTLAPLQGAADSLIFLAYPLQTEHQCVPA